MTSATFDRAVTSSETTAEGSATPSRRTFLAGAVAGVAATLLPSAAEPASAQTLQYYDHLYWPNWDLRRRTGYAYGAGAHGPTEAFQFNPAFWQKSSDLAKHFSDSINAATGANIDYFGCAGVYVNKSGQHGEGRAFDLTQIRYTNGDFIDMNLSWRHTLTHRRRYVATACLARCYFAEVGTAGTGDGHDNHIHWDPDNPGNPGISRGSGYDTHIVQRACNEMNGESIPVDGDFGSVTEGAFNRLLAASGKAGTDPFGSYRDMAGLFTYLADRGFAGLAA